MSVTGRCLESYVDCLWCHAQTEATREEASSYTCRAGLADLAATAYGLSRTLYLAAATAVLIKPLDVEIRALVIGLGALLPFALALSALYTEGKTIALSERFRHRTTGDREAIKARLLASWTLYCLAAYIFGQPSFDLFRLDVKIMATRVAKVALAIGLGAIPGLGDNPSLNVPAIICLVSLVCFVAVPGIHICMDGPVGKGLNLHETNREAIAVLIEGIDRRLQEQKPLLARTEPEL